jgi:hypothetical protein
MRHNVALASKDLRCLRTERLLVAAGEQVEMKQQRQPEAQQKPA